MKIKTMLFVALLAMSGQSNARMVSTIGLVNDCEDSNLYCTGYLLGVADALDGGAFCIPIKATRTQLKKVFIGYASVYSTDTLASDLFKAAFGQMFPCK